MIAFEPGPPQRGGAALEAWCAGGGERVLVGTLATGGDVAFGRQRKKGSRCTSRLRVLINTATTTHSSNGVAVQFRTALTGESGRALHNFPFTSKIR